MRAQAAEMESQSNLANLSLLSPGLLLLSLLDDNGIYSLVYFSFPCSGNGKQASWGAIFGFILMMCLDVGLG